MAEHASKTQRHYREMLSRAYTLVQSRSQLDLSIARTIDESRDMELEEIEGVPDDRTPLLKDFRRRLSDMERVEEVRTNAISVIEGLRGDPSVISTGEDSS